MPTQDQTLSSDLTWVTQEWQMGMPDCYHLRCGDALLGTIVQVGAPMFPVYQCNTGDWIGEVKGSLEDAMAAVEECFPEYARAAA